MAHHFRNSSFAEMTIDASKLLSGTGYHSEEQCALAYAIEPLTVSDVIMDFFIMCFEIVKVVTMGNQYSQ